MRDRAAARVRAGRDAAVRLSATWRCRSASSRRSRRRYIVAYMTEAARPVEPDGQRAGNRHRQRLPGRHAQPAGQGGIHDRNQVDTLAERARQAFEQLDYENIHQRVGDGYQGWAEHAPFDKIIVTCSPEKVPQPLVEQLREGGRIVIPLGERYQQMLYSLVKREGKLVGRGPRADVLRADDRPGRVDCASGAERAADAASQRRLRRAARRDKPVGWYLPAASPARRDGRQAAGRELPGVSQPGDWLQLAGAASHGA